MKRHWYDTFPFEISNLEIEQETLEIWYGELFEEPTPLLSHFLLQKWIQIWFTCEAMQHYRIDVDTVSCQLSSCPDHFAINCRSATSEFLRSLCHRLALESLVHKISTKRSNRISDIIERFYPGSRRNFDLSIIFCPSTFWIFLTLQWKKWNKLENSLLLQI